MHIDDLGLFIVGVFAIIQAVVPHSGLEALGVNIFSQFVDIVGENVFPLCVGSDGFFCVVVQYALIIGSKGTTVEFHILVAADMEIGAALKQLHVLVVQAADIGDCFRIGHIQTGRIVSALVADLTIFGMSFQNLVHMTGAVKRGDHLNAVLSGFFQNFTDFIFGQIFVGNNCGVGFALNAEAQILGEVHLDGVHLQERHFPDLTDEPVFGDVLSGAVHMETAFGNIGVIDDGAIGQTVIGHHIILNGAQCIHDGVFAGSGNFHAIFADLNSIGFFTVGIFTNGVFLVQNNQNVSGPHILFIGINHGKGIGGDDFLFHEFGVDQLNHFSKTVVCHIFLCCQHSQTGFCRHGPGFCGIVHCVLLYDRVDQHSQFLTGHGLSGDTGRDRRRFDSLCRGQHRGENHRRGQRHCQNLDTSLVIFFHCYKSFPFSFFKKEIIPTGGTGRNFSFFRF